MSIILIGMPGAGKSTLGRALAKKLALPFIDTDQVVEQSLGCSLQQALDTHGYLAMRELEGAIIAEHPWPGRPMVIATGGSVVYSRQAMQRLRQLGVCVYLNVSLRTVKIRVKNWQSRGFSAAPGQTLEAVFTERELLYRHYSHATVDCDGLSRGQCLQRLLDVYNRYRQAP